MLVALSASRGSLASSSAYRLQVVRADGAGSCPSEASIERDVSQRLGRQAFSTTGERGIEVVLERTESKWVARLYLRLDANEPDAARLLESDSLDCAELGKSVALAVALAIAPELPPEPAPEPPPPAAPAPIAVLPPPPPRSLEDKPSLHGSASLRAVASPNVLPHSTLGAALAVALRGQLLGASFGAVFFPENRLQSGEAELGFGISAAFASGCLWARTKEPQVWSCIGAQLGALHSIVYSPEPTRPGDRLWGAASSELGLRQHLLGRAFVELGVAAVFPFVRQRFQLGAATSDAAATTPNGARTVYEQGPALVEGFLGLGLRLD